MSVLLIDAGNTRIKWARCADGDLGVVHAAAHARWGAADYSRRVVGSGGGLERILVASVAGPKLRGALARAARRAQVPIMFVTVPRRGGGVTVGYLEPWRLGVDRFVALVAARHLFPGVPVCVAGVGTALTLDLLGQRGRHCGGAILPGPALMVQALLTRTHGIRRRAQGGAPRSRGPFARSTRAAIEQGARYAAAAAIDRAVDEGSVYVGRSPLVVLTGGGAREVRSLVRSSCVGVPDLVLKGLAVLAGREPRR